MHSIVSLRLFAIGTTGEDPQVDITGGEARMQCLEERLSISWNVWLDDYHCSARETLKGYRLGCVRTRGTRFTLGKFVQSSPESSKAAEASHLFLLEKFSSGPKRLSDAPEPVVATHERCKGHS